MTEAIAMPPTLRIAAALIEDGAGRLLLVRKHGTPWFMQPGGKIEPGETALAALLRELREELAIAPPSGSLRPLGRFRAPAANEPDHLVDAELFHLSMPSAAPPIPAAELAEAVWLDARDATALPLAPLTRDHVLPLLRTFRPATLAAGRSGNHQPL